MTQGNAVYAAVVAVLGGEIDGPVQLTDIQLKEVEEAVFFAFKSGQCTKNSGGQDDGSLKKYIPGLVNNWLRKDLRLNGGVKYQAKNPGSRSGTGDDTIRNMKVLLKHFEGNIEAQEQIQLEINKRIEELKPPKTTVDVSKLPESLKHLIPS